MELDKAIEGILSVRKRLEDAWGNPGQLSDLGNKMSAYNAYLGDHLGQLKADREVKKSAAYLELVDTKSATAADNLARAKVATITGQVMKLELMHKDTASQVSMIQSRLRVIADEMRGNV
jgi:hypothetical protein